MDPTQIVECDTDQVRLDPRAIAAQTGEGSNSVIPIHECLRTTTSHGHVVDVWDALSSDRPYRKRMPHEEVVDYLIKEAGRLFDPEIVNKFIPLIKESTKQ